MPKPTQAASAYLPGLDGIRTIAVALVVLYHAGLPLLPGGLLGVGVFFTLSGFLITNVLMHGWQHRHRLALGDFWVRRARRLLPAAVTVLIVVVATTAVTDPSRLGSRVREALAALFYVANWSTIAAGESYFSRFEGPQPLDHMWSLSIEEQFYLVWPLALALLVIGCRARRLLLAAATTALAAGSFWLLAALASPGLDNTRAYEGTDTRAGGLLLGAALALAWPTLYDRTLGSPRGNRRLIDALGWAGLAAIIILAVTTDDYSMSLYRWGLLALTLATCAVLAAACLPGTSLGRVLSTSPLRWVGERSYGIYLWHMPVLAFLPLDIYDLGPVARALVGIGLTVLLAAVSWTMLEDPIRRNGFRATFARPATPSWPGAARQPAGAYSAALFLPLALLACLVPPLVQPGSGGSGSPSASLISDSGAETAPLDHEEPPVEPPATPSNTPTPAPAIPSPTRAAQDAATPPAARHAASAPRTTCRTVTHVGDSTSIGLTSTSMLPNASDRQRARLAAVGVQKFNPQISGGRSIVETLNGIPNAATAARNNPVGPNGCWVFALGTNESANVAVGSRVGLRARIDRMMAVADGRPVLWLTVKTLRSHGPYRNATAQSWNAELRMACARYPNMRVYDWAAEVRRGWFIDDGIHFNTPGYRERAKRIASALAAAFPDPGTSPKSCLIRTR